ncbi:MAG TPA: BamA/TamA family outer membrane protein, partial [Calditrichia bacterium]|nr:BamA/TamA family outer membrane protein [Calditrichia bacterium]
LPGLLPALLTPAEIDNLVDRIYAIQVFERVGYRIMPIPGKVSNKLLIKVEEKSENRFQAGLRYDNRHNAFLLLNTRFYNLLTDLSTLDLDLKLGELSRFALQYDLPVGWSSSMATRLGIDFGEDRIDLYQRDRRAQRFTTRSLTSTLFMGSLRAKNVLIGAGVRGQLLRQEVDIGNVDQAEKDIYTASGFARMGLDYTDSKTFPVRGFRSELNVEGSTDRLNSDPAFFRVMGSGDLFLPLHRHWTLLVSGEAGTVRGDSLSLIRPYYLGGVREPRTFQGLPRSFYGLRAQERIAEHLMVGAGGLQWKDNSGWFAQFHYNVAAIFEARLLGERQPLVQGWGALVGYELPVGPLVFAAHGGNGQLHTFLSMGFFF